MQRNSQFPIQSRLKHLRAWFLCSVASAASCQFFRGQLQPYSKANERASVCMQLGFPEAGQPAVFCACNAVSQIPSLNVSIAYSGRFSDVREKALHAWSPAGCLCVQAPPLCACQCPFSIWVEHIVQPYGPIAFEKCLREKMFCI